MLPDGLTASPPNVDHVLMIALVAIKDRVAEDPGRYIQQEPGIIDMLKRYRSSGRKVFLLTNSLWDYTHVVMNHINGFSKPEERNLDWLDLFDLVIVGGGKPTFLEDENLPIFRVHPEDQGRLSNMDNALFDPPEVSLAAGKVFQGGNGAEEQRVPGSKMC